MSSRKSPPSPIESSSSNKIQNQNRNRSRPPSRTPSHAHSHSQTSAQGGSDDEIPTSTLRARNVTGTSMREFPPSPSTPRAGGREGSGEGREGRDGREGGGVAGGNGGGVGNWRLPGVKGTMGGIASPGRSQFPSSPAWSPAPSNAVQQRRPNGEQAQPPRPPLTFRTDPTIKSCLDTLPLDSRDELRRMFGVS
ncbi:uncharacterized protein MKK02DRAFT_42091 [Dioszegia hungarica]|uniref:Uncharacterized protein n=1 Tax=Dioszegia hungarica TaxID=4972 RepID=A0AA38HES4_9TREE|nr:uncharacterized protein MKK02DRAFT_42091 [Dioszegia hungarica]KAI9639050.1 hypothetical protein MKK02DRAFT_42091 [Dioszegia hungarica]